MPESSQMLPDDRHSEYAEELRKVIEETPDEKLQDWAEELRPGVVEAFERRQRFSPYAKYDPPSPIS